MKKPESGSMPFPRRRTKNAESVSTVVLPAGYVTTGPPYPPSSEPIDDAPANGDENESPLRPKRYTTAKNLSEAKPLGRQADTEPGPLYRSRKRATKKRLVPKGSKKR